jgi:Zn-dependent M28 family amino/carboxypeptidase
LTPDGRWIDTGGCDAANWAQFVPGHIAVIESGPCFRLDQVLNAQNAGAIGLISLYPHWLGNQTRRPTLIDPGAVTIPAIVAGGEPTAAILAALAAGGSAQVHVAVETHPVTIDNVIAEIRGASDEVVMLGGHLDSVLDGPGINDNGSGVATLLSLARSVSEQPQPPPRTIRFAFWGAEEFGEFGSAAYVAGLDAAQRSRIHAYLNLDMVASPNAGRFVYDEPDASPGSDELRDALMTALSEAGTAGAPISVGGASDHFSFQQAGIPIGGVFSGLNPLLPEQAALFNALPTEPADPCYHLACDTRENVNLGSAVTLGNAVANVVQDIAFLP